MHAQTVRSLAAALELIAEHGVATCAWTTWPNEPASARPRSTAATARRRSWSRPPSRARERHRRAGHGLDAADLLALMRDAVDVYRGPVAAGRDAEPGRGDAARPELARAVARASWPGGARRFARCSSAASSAATCAPTSTSSSRSTCSAGPLFYRLLITGGPIDERLADGRRRADPARLRAQPTPAEAGRRKPDEDPRNPDRHRRHHDAAGARASATANAGSLNTLLDREWTEPLPIYAFAIEHPEGVIVVDTGETARVAEPGYFPRWQPVLPLRRSRAGRARGGDRPAARAAGDRAMRRPPGRDDPPAHRPRRRTAPLPAQRDPRLAGRARLRGGTARARLRGYPEQALAGLVSADARRPGAGAGSARSRAAWRSRRPAT